LTVGIQALRLLALAAFVTTLHILTSLKTSRIEGIVIILPYCRRQQHELWFVLGNLTRPVAESIMTDPHPVPFPVFLSPKAAAKIINISPKSLYNWIRQGNGPPSYKIGPLLIRIRKDELLRWLEQQRTNKDVLHLDSD
jgi:excisionase family DNA binding protein